MSKGTVRGLAAWVWIKIWVHFLNFQVVRMGSWVKFAFYFSTFFFVLDKNKICCFWESKRWVWQSLANQCQVFLFKLCSFWIYFVTFAKSLVKIILVASNIIISWKTSGSVSVWWFMVISLLQDWSIRMIISYAIWKSVLYLWKLLTVGYED